MGYIHFAFLGEESHWAAEASECASDQDKFWEFYDFLYSNQNGENQGAFTKDNLKLFAQTLGLDTTTFNACLDSGKHTETVQANTRFAQELGVRSTPSFVVNGQPVIGGQPFEVFQEMIDGMLSINQ